MEHSINIGGVVEDVRLTPKERQRMRNQCFYMMKAYQDKHGYLTLDLFNNKQIAELVHKLDEGPMALLVRFIAVQSEYDFSI